jgi:hypothetical protein
VPAHALWLIWITERLGISRIAEIAKRKANLVRTGESNNSSFSSTTNICRYYFASKNGLFTAVVFSIFKLTYPTPAADVR